LAEALALVCEAPTRAEADPRWHSTLEAGDRAMLVGEHANEGVSNARVLAWFKVPTEQRAPDLDKMLQEASIASCRLREIWKRPAD
jgi:hypothetical protein